MEQISNGAVGSYMADYQYRTEQAKKNETTEKSGKTGKVSGRTIGEPKLSEKAAKYYEKLKAKYSNMEFILVSPDKKEEAEQNKGMYQSSKELLVLIDSDKIEKMAEDESYRKKYEAILSGATTQMNQMKSSLGANADKVRSFGMTFDDNGTASLFAVIDKSLAKQRERITEKKEKNAADRKKEAKEAAAERREQQKEKTGRTEKWDGSVSAADRENTITVTAPTWSELLKKIDYVIFSERADYLKTDAEKAVGGSIDYAL